MTLMQQIIGEATPAPISCSCNYNNPVVAYYATISPYAYISYPKSAIPWECAFICCRDSPHGTNSRVPTDLTSDMYIFFAYSGLIPTWTWMAMKCDSGISCHWYNDSATPYGPTFPENDPCSICPADLNMVGAMLVAWYDSIQKISVAWMDPKQNYKWICQCLQKMLVEIQIN